MFTWSDRSGRLAGSAVTKRLGWQEIGGLTKADDDNVLDEREPGTAALARQLADDAVDLLDLALALEVDFSVVASQLRSGNVRTYSELTDALLALTRSRLRDGNGSTEPEPFVWIRIVPGDRTAIGTVHGGPLSDDAVRAVTEAAFAAGRGTRVEITVARGTKPAESATASSKRGRGAHEVADSGHARTTRARDTWMDADELARVATRFSLLRARGIDVDVRRPDDVVALRIDRGTRGAGRGFWHGRGGTNARSTPRISGRLNIAVGPA